MVEGKDGIIINSKTTCLYAINSNLPQKIGPRGKGRAMPNGKWLDF